MIDPTQPLELFDPISTWKRKTIVDFVVKELQVPIFKEGVLVYTSPTLSEMRSYCSEQVNTLWDEVTRFESPHRYYVDLSEKLWAIKDEMLKK